MDAAENFQDLNSDKDTIGDDSDFTEESRLRVACRYIVKGFKIFIAFLFSHIGLTCFVAGYTLLGGILFQRLELPHEQGIRDVATGVKNSSVEKIMDFIDSNEIDFVLQKSVWHAHVRKILRDHELELNTLTREKNWDGSFGDEPYQWTFANALLYSVTVITTIGYGNIAPKTKWGQVVTILYATFGIPMTMLCLRNIGNLMAGCFRLIYRFACVNMTYQYIKLQRRRLKNRFVTRLRTKTQDLKEWAKRKHSEVSHRIHSAIEEHRLSSTDIRRKGLSSEDVHSVPLEPIEENTETDEEELDRNEFNGSEGDIARREIKASTKQRRNTISVISNTSPHKSHRKHSLVSSKRHQPRDLLRHAKGNDSQLSFSGLAIISEDDITVDFGDSPQERCNEPGKSSRESSVLSLRDFEADERLLKARLRQTRNLVPISMCLLIMTGYIILGAMIFTPWEENWDFLIGFYFCFITLTTIGFGDFVPGMATSWHNDEKRVFCVGYLLFGMALLAMSFHLIQEEVKHKCRKIAIKIGLIEERITQFLDSYDQ